jgi:hypothetical protein
MNWQAQGRLFGLAAGSVFVLACCPPRLDELRDGLGSPWRWVAEVGPDAAAGTIAGALLWLVALWVALGLAVTAASLLPGRLGRLGGAIANRLTPAALRRVVAAATSTSILLSPAAAIASPTGGHSPAPAGAASVLPAIGWPTDPGPAARQAVPPPRAGSSGPPGAERTAAPGAAGRVRVRAGDSLWSIAGRRLGPAAPATRIQQEWPRWYAANRQLIGPDPDLIRPGTSLRPPAAGLLAPGTAPADTDR